MCGPLDSHASAHASLLQVKVGAECELLKKSRVAGVILMLLDGEV